MDYSEANIRWIEKNYHELRIFSEAGGRSYWQKVTKSPGLTSQHWTDIVLDLVAFDTALKHIGKMEYLENMREAEYIRNEVGDERLSWRIPSEDIKEMKKWLNRRVLD